MDKSIDPKSLLEDPILSVSLKGTYIKINTKSTVKSLIVGYLYCIDPASGTVVLLIPDENLSKINQIELVFLHSINSLEVEEGKTLPVTLFEQFKQQILQRNNKETFSEEEISKRKDKLLNVLKDSQLPYEEKTEGNIFVASVATISPPYTIQSIKCTNGIVLTRLKELISTSMSDL